MSEESQKSISMHRHNNMNFILKKDRSIVDHSIGDAK